MAPTAPAAQSSGQPAALATIGPALVSEAETILKLQYLCFQQEAALYNDYTIPPLTQTLASLLAEYDTHRILVARLGNEVVGSVRGNLNGQACYVGRVIVHPRLQKQGLGARLLQSIEREFPEVEYYELFTGDRSQGNLRLYQRLGYVPVGTKAITADLVLVYMRKQNPSRSR